MACVHLIWTMFVYGFGCFFFIHGGTPMGSFPESFVKIQLDLAEIFRILKQCLFVCLFVCLLIDLFFVCFCFNCRGTPTGSFPKSFVKI